MKYMYLFACRFFLLSLCIFSFIYRKAPPAILTFTGGLLSGICVSVNREKEHDEQVGTSNF